MSSTRIDRTAIVDPERTLEAWVAHASRVLVSASRRNSLSLCSICPATKAQGKVREREDAFANTRDACATRSTPHS